MDNSWVITTVKEDRYDEFINFIYKDFFPRESLIKTSGLDIKLDPKFHKQMETWLRDDISLIAIDLSTEQIIGICYNYITEKHSSSPQADESSSNETQIPDNIVSFLNYLQEGYNIYKELGVERGMELHYLGVKEGYGGCGIARKLTEKTIELARTKRLEFIQSTPSTGATRHLFESLGFETISEKKAIDYFIDGQPVFPYASDKDISRFVVKKLC